MGAVTIVVAGIVCPSERIQPVSAAVRIDPHVRCQVFMRVTHPRIQHRYHDVTGRGQHLPGLRRVDVGVRGAAVLPGVVQSPKRAIQIFWIVRRRRRLHQVIRFGKLHQSALLVFGHQFRNPLSSGHP